MKGTDVRLDSSLQQMLREMEALFGEEMWNHIVVGVTFWSFDEDVVEDKDICIDVTRILDQVPLNYRKPIIFYFGLFGKTRQTPAQIKNYYKVDIEEVLEYLRNAKEIKEILEDYNE